MNLPLAWRQDHKAVQITVRGTTYTVRYGVGVEKAGWLAIKGGRNIKSNIFGMFWEFCTFSWKSVFNYISLNSSNNICPFRSTVVMSMPLLKFQFWIEVGIAFSLQLKCSASGARITAGHTTFLCCLCILFLNWNFKMVHVHVTVVMHIPYVCQVRKTRWRTFLT